MIVEGTGNILTAQADALVNTVNTVGVMGRGIALQFKQAFPDNFRQYQSACRRGEVVIGKMFVTHTGKLHPRYIINFPTKQHWREQAKLNYISAGLSDLIDVVEREGIASIALPPLGCGLGGLRWEQVRPLVEQAFSDFPHVEAHLFAPNQALPAEDRVVRTMRPQMTLWRAALIRLMQAYSCLAFEASHLEAQKLLYFLFEAGEPLKANFVRQDYGPYDDSMKHGLMDMEGHYLLGFGDGKRLDPVRLASGAAQEAGAFLLASPATEERIGRVIDLIHGFETPYGLELLASVHWGGCSRITRGLRLAGTRR